MAARTDLIRIQKRLVERYREEIKRSLADYSPIMEHYRADYEREVSSYKRTATQRELIEKVLHSDIVYCGDYHTLFVAQRAPIRILSQVVQPSCAGREVRKIVLVLEMIRADRQPLVDRFMRDEIDEKVFLGEVDYERAWGFVWDHYRIFFEFAKQYGIRVVGMNCEPCGVTNHLRARDEFAATVIAREAEENPGALIFVVDGDWHVAPHHLPQSVDKLLKKRDLVRKRLIIFQNSEQIYWQLCRKRLEHRIDVVQIHKDTYCIIAATPLVKLQSYLNWERGVEEVGYGSLWERDLGGEDYTEQMSLIIKTIAEYLGIKEERLNNFTLYSTADLDFLEIVKERGKFLREELEKIKNQIQQDESYFIPEGNIIYLSNLSINHAAEEAAHFINSVCTGKVPKRENAFDAFYRRVIAEALGFLGSKIINHKRQCYSIRDFSDFLVENRGKKLPAELTAMRQVAKFVFQHKKFEERFAKTQRYGALPRKIYEAKDEVFTDVAHALGYILGDQLYQAMISDAIGREEVREFFYRKFDLPFSAFATYINIRNRVAEVWKVHREESEEW